MSYLMDYGPDYPPAEPERIDWRRLAQRCINTLAVYCAIAGLGLAALSIRDASQQTSSSTPHGGYRMTILSPSPHVAK